MISEQKDQGRQLCNVTLDTFMQINSSLQIKIVGSIKNMFKHQRYIVEVYYQEQIIIRCFKRYNDFQALYQLIKMKYKNEDLGQFPSKFQLFGRQQTRKEYFENFLIGLIRSHQESTRLLSIVYLFLAKDIKIQQQKNKSIISGFQAQRKEKNTQNVIRTLSMGTQQKPSQAKMHRYSLDYTAQQKKPRKNSEGDRFSFQQQQTNLISDQKKKILRQFQVKFQNEQEWKVRFLKIQGSSLLMYNKRLDNSFRTKIELYQIKIEFLKRNQSLIQNFCEKMDFHIQTTFTEDPSILSIYHQYDNYKVLIRERIYDDQITKNQSLQQLKNDISKVSQAPLKGYDLQGVFQPIGKIFVILQKLTLEWPSVSSEETIILKIKTSAFQYESKKMLYRNTIDVKQGFLIPISSTFQHIIIQCLIIKDEGWLRQGQLEKVIGWTKISMSDLLTLPGYHQKISAQMKGSSKEFDTKLTYSIDNMSHYTSIYSDSFANENDGKIIKNLKLEDATELIMAIQRILKMVSQIFLFMKALYRNAYLFKYPRVGYTFFSSLICLCLFADVNTLLYVVILILVTGIFYNHPKGNKVINYLGNKYLFILHPCFKIPQVLNTVDLKLLKWSNNLKYMNQDYRIESDEGFKYKLEATNFKRTCYTFERHGITFRYLTQQTTLFEKISSIRRILQIIHKYLTAIVNIIEKITSLLTWVDKRKTIAILILLFLLTGIAAFMLIKFLIILLCIHRLVKGREFYRYRHYKRNRMYAVYSMAYILNKSFPNLIPKNASSTISEKQEKSKKANTVQRLSLKDLSYQKLQEIISQIVLPIQNEQFQKKLRNDMEEVVGVYFDAQGMAEKMVDKGPFKMKTVLQMIETCESRLRLKWIPGKQSFTKDFNQLKALTAYVPTIDVWAQSLLFNIVLNTPSQFYKTFHHPHNE